MCFPQTRCWPNSVARSDDHGKSWRSIVNGLPTDFGTTTGQLWTGREGGEEWECLFDALPPIYCVKVAAV